MLNVNVDCFFYFILAIVYKLTVLFSFDKKIKYNIKLYVYYIIQFIDS